jgi:hypothetical protein
MMLDQDLYEKTKEDITSEVLNDFSSRKEQVKLITSDGEVKVTLGEALTNLMMLKFSITQDIPITKDLILSGKKVNGDEISKIFNRVLNKIKEIDNLNYDHARLSISESINEMSDISGEINVRAGNTISIQDFVRLAATDENAKKIFNVKFDDNVKFSEIEDEFDRKGQEILDYFSKKKDSDLYNYVWSKTGLNLKQLTQAISFVGLKPDMDGSIIPVVIDGNYVRGLGNIESYYINSKGTRKALVTNFNNVRQSGYLTRKLSLSCIDRYHDNNIDDCGTKHFVNVNVLSSKHLSRIKNRHYHLLDEDGEPILDKLYTVDETDRSLIGKTIAVRSPITCASEKVCKTCYGRELSELNKDLNTGLIAVVLQTNPLTQRMLSAKHLLSTNTNKVEWGEEFEEYFTIDRDNILLSDSDVNIVIDIKDVLEDEAQNLRYINKFKITSKRGKLLVDYESPVNLYLNEDIFRNFIRDDQEVKFNLNDIQVNQSVFYFIAKNNELTVSLKRILELIEHNDHLGVEDYHEMTNKYLELLIDNNMKLDSIHAEMIVSSLIRRVDKLTQRPDFSKEELDDYEILRVSKAVLNSPISVSLAFERLLDQLTSIETYDKHESSIIDSLFK